MVIRTKIWTCVLALAAAGAVFPCLGCGGGGGGGPAGPGANVFSGTYYVSHLEATGGPPRALACAWGKSTADGFGALSGDVTTNTSGVVTGPSSIGGYVATIGADRSLTVQSTLAPGVDVAVGGITTDGRVAALNLVDPAAHPGIQILTRQEGAFGLSTLAGDYHACGFRHFVGSDAMQSYFGSSEFDGAGGGSLRAPANSEGVIVHPLGSALFTYTVTAGGGTTFDFGGGNSRRGGILAGGDLVVVSGAPTTLRSPILYALVRQSTAASLTTLSGRYFVVGLRYVLGTTSFLSVHGTADADGAGGVMVDLTANAEGTLSTLPVDASTYTVALNGQLEVTNSAGDVLRGGVSPTGDFAVLGGSTTTGQDPMFLFLLR